MNVELHRPPKPEEGQKNFQSFSTEKTIPYPGFEPKTSALAVVQKLDVQLNNVMRLITGTVKSTELQWLPVLSNIAPPKLRREAALFRELKNSWINGKSLSFKMSQRWDSVQETQFGLTLAPPKVSMFYWNVGEKCGCCRLQFTVT
jgi:hypothetical protein